MITWLTGAWWEEDGEEDDEGRRDVARDLAPVFIPRLLRVYQIALLRVICISILWKNWDKVELSDKTSTECAHFKRISITFPVHGLSVNLIVS